jgi:hypothetical protein
MGSGELPGSRGTASVNQHARPLFKAKRMHRSSRGDLLNWHRAGNAHALKAHGGWKVVSI